MVDGVSVIRGAKIALCVAGALLVALVLAGAAQARSTSASDYSMVHLTKGKHKGEIVLTVRVHLDRRVGARERVRVRVVGPTKRAVVVGGSHRTTAHERATNTVDLRAHLTRQQVRRLFGDRLAPVRAQGQCGSCWSRVGISVGTPGSGTAAPRSGPSTTTITVEPTTWTQPFPSRAVFAPNGNPQVWLDVVWGRDMNASSFTLVPFVSSLAVPDGTVRGCQPSGGPQIFEGVNPFRGPFAPPMGPSPAPPTGRVQSDGTFTMSGESSWSGSAECWPSSTVTGTFSAVPNAQGMFPGSTTVTATWSTGGRNPQSGTVSYALQAQSSCSTFGPRRCF